VGRGRGRPIVAVGSGAPLGDEVVDHSDAVLALGFVDVQIIEAGTVDFEPRASTRSSPRSTDLACGCTTCVPTIVSAALDDTQAYSTGWRRCDRRRRRGVHPRDVPVVRPAAPGRPGSAGSERRSCCDRHVGPVRTSRSLESDPELAALER
jgi:hypothetical protein